jgi:UDPglucose 6-dehydrogenase
LKAGCKVRLFDPVAIEEARKAIDRSINPSLQQDIYFASDIYDTVNDADALMLVTEWKEFRMPNWEIVKKLMKNHIVLDGRNIYDKKEMSEMGFTYEGVGV